jgi:uncharacterized membrane protein YhiD involved in acid resistance
MKQMHEAALALPLQLVRRHMEEALTAVVRLPLAALLGTALALRPKRRGTPTRTTAVVQTQIILALVGAVIMLVVGASLARAFGIVGAASLIRYRSKIEDPKDAVVMLGSLSVGLASGVGLYVIAALSTVFLVTALWIIESLEPQPSRHFTLTIKAGEQAEALRPKVEQILQRHRLGWELRTLAGEELQYDVKVKLGVKPDPILAAIAATHPSGQLAVEWQEQKKQKAS